MKRPSPTGWRDLQRAVAEVFTGDGYTTQVEVTLQTTRSPVNFDVFAQKAVGGHTILIAVECKNWRKHIPQAVVHAFRTQVEDFGADAGYIVSSAGFQSGAYEAAKNTSIRLVTWDQFLTQFEPEGPPLGPGLKGTAEIANGSICFHGKDGEVLPFASSIITGGSIKRDEAGLVAYIKAESPFPGFNEANTIIGWKGFELRSTAGSLSAESDAPTVLEGQTEFTTAPGMRGLHPLSGDMMTFPGPVHCKLVIRAEGFIQGDTFAGAWFLTAHSDLVPQPVPLRGSFSMRLLPTVARNPVIPPANFAREASENARTPSGGQGGRGGNAHVSRSGTAIGGAGGGGGPGGKGGDGGDGAISGDGFAMGGEGGEAGQTNRGGRGGRSPIEILGFTNLRLPDGRMLWDLGLGGDGTAPRTVDPNGDKDPNPRSE
jgi:hypothetical protein